MFDLKRLSFCFSFVVTVVFAIQANNNAAITIIAGGETHAMLFPCDCPVNPGGGLAKRASIFKSMIGDTTLLLDAGGFAGGGLYDSYTEGRANDSLRTIATIRAMAAIGYDAVAIGDDDLQYGGRWLADEAKNAGLTLVSSNCLFGDSTFIGAPYVLVKKHGKTFAIAGLTTQERLFPPSDSVVILPPLEALKKIWPDMVKKADYRIVLSHLGEELSQMIADSLPQCDVVINGHRKSSTEAVIQLGKTLFMQFGFGGKEFSRARLKAKKNGLSVIESGWVPVSAENPNDSLVLKIINSWKSGTPGRSTPSSSKGIVLDLYIMSQCPYGLSALKELTDAMASFPKIEWHVWFIGSPNPDSSLSSLHGNKEVDDEMLWLAIQSLYPDRWLEFLRIRSSESEKQTSTTAITVTMGLDHGRLSTWTQKKGKQELLVHYARSSRLNIHSSPTLLLNNTGLDAEITKPRLGKVLCGQAPGSSSFCDSIPECLDNGDCKKKGKVGTCLTGKGKPHCEFAEAVRFTFTVLTADSMVSHPENEIINATRDLFEGAVIETISVKSAAGRKLRDAFDPKTLPLYLFDTNVAKAKNFSQIESGIERSGGKFTFKNGYVKKAYFYKRPLAAGACDVYIDPMFPGVKEALAIALRKRPGPRIRIMPLLAVSPDIDSISGDDRFGREEAQRWLLMSRRYGAQYAAYLESFMKRKDASYWFLSLKDLTIDVDDFVKNIKSDDGRLRALWETMTELGLSGPVELFINNREVVRVKNQKDLETMVEALRR